MRIFTLYEFKFWRYLIVAVGIILFIIFGSLYLESTDYFSMEGWNQLYFICMAGISMFIGIKIGASLATNTHTITLSKSGLLQKIQTPFSFGKHETEEIPWEDIEAYSMEEFGNGTILNFSLRSTGKKYSFTNSMLKKSEDMNTFYEALKNGADSFNELHNEETAQIGKLPGFYSGTFALVSAFIIAVFLLVIPFLIASSANEQTDYSQYFKLIWFYMLGVFLIWKVYQARRLKGE